jgi:hypothetical protein
MVAEFCMGAILTEMDIIKKEITHLIFWDRRINVIFLWRAENQEKQCSTSPPGSVDHDLHMCFTVLKHISYEQSGELLSHLNFWNRRI